MVTRVCDYTGTALSWTPGPRVISLEAIYPFAIKDDHIAYHANPNVCFIATAVNFSKKRHAPLYLPLVAAWLNCHDEGMSFNKRRNQWAWRYNALSNVATMSHIFHLEIPHADQINVWQQWTPEGQRDALEVLKTETRLPLLDRLLSGFNSRNLFRGSEDRPGNPQPSKIEAGKIMYHTLVQIGLKHGLTKAELEYYLTIPSPRPLDRDFYPFHVLSRPQANENGWDWNEVTALRGFMIRTLTKYCNEFGEDGLGRTTMVYMPWTRSPEDFLQYPGSAIDFGDTSFSLAGPLEI
ncbi:hypothetical protein GGI35DRAFT_482179 [Trichoderma velutinum]